MSKIENLKWRLKTSKEAHGKSLAEIERLKAEKAEALAALEPQLAVNDALSERAEQAEAEIERLKAKKTSMMLALEAELDRLEARLAKVVEALRDINTVDEHGLCDSGYSVAHVARAALAAAQPQREHCGICGLYACGGHAAAQPKEESRG